MLSRSSSLCSALSICGKPVSRFAAFFMPTSFLRLLRTCDCSALPTVMVLWPLLTSHRSLLLHELQAVARLSTPVRPSRVFTHSSTLYPPHLPQTIPYSFWALTSYGVLPSFGALYATSVRQARALSPPFFRFRLAADTLGFGYILPAIGRIRDFHPLGRALTERTKTTLNVFKTVV